MTEETTAIAPRAPLNSGGAIAPIVPQNIEQVFRLARAIKVANFAPKSYKTEEEVAVAIMHGLEVGLTPMAALQSIAVINGTPTIWGDGALALVRASGVLVNFKEWMDGETAYCQAQRRDQAEPITRSFSVADAKTAKLWGKRGRDGQDTPWITYPARMLAMRARSWCLRDGFADVLRGLKMREEVMDYAEQAKDVTPAPAKIEAKGNGFRLPTPPAPEPEQSPVADDLETGEVIEPMQAPAVSPESAPRRMGTVGATPTPAPEPDEPTMADKTFAQAMAELNPGANLDLWTAAYKAHMRALSAEQQQALRDKYAAVKAAQKEVGG